MKPVELIDAPAPTPAQLLRHDTNRACCCPFVRVWHTGRQRKALARDDETPHGGLARTHAKTGARVWGRDGARCSPHRVLSEDWGEGLG